MPDIHDLNTRFGIPDTLSFVCGSGGLVMIQIEHPAASARIALQGAHLLDWTPAGEQAVIWLSRRARFAPGKAIRGGIPVCWPWFGPHPSESEFPAHGFARVSPWIVEQTRAEPGGVALRLRMLQDEASETLWPYASALILDFRIGRQLDLCLSSRNHGVTPIQLSEALHAYFRIGDLSGTRIHGLEGNTYVDKTDVGKHQTQAGPIAVDGEIDRIYTAVRGQCRIVDPGLSRVIRIATGDARSTIVWNPGPEKTARLHDMEPNGYQEMVCVETANADSDSVTVAPGSTHRLSVSYSVEKLC